MEYMEHFIPPKLRERTLHWALGIAAAQRRGEIDTTNWTRQSERTANLAIAVAGFFTGILIGGYLPDTSIKKF